VCFALPLVGFLPATVAMGATLVAWERVLATRVSSGAWIAGLYAANTAGAVGGVLLTVGGLQAKLGLAGTTGAWAALNLACGFGLWGLRSRRAGAESSVRVQAGPSVLPRVGRKSGAVLVRLGVGGLLAIGFEVLVVRLLSLVLEGTVFTYATVLVTWLVGTALGALLARSRWCRTEVVLAAVPVALLASGLCLGRSLGWFEALRRAWGDSAFAVMAAEFSVAALIVLPATVLMGAVFSRWVQEAVDDGWGAGAALGWNTLGAAVAPALIGVLIFPALGGKGTLVLLAVGYSFLLAPQWRWWVPTAVGVGLIFLTLPADLRLLQLPPRARLLEFREGAVDSVAVIEQFGSNVTLSVNNRFVMGGTASTNAAARHSHLPLLLHPDPRRALFLGLGTGISFAAMGGHPGLTADGVELVRDIVAVQPRFAPHNERAANLRLHLADARRFVRTVPGPYDVIVADLFHPARDGAGALYTVEQFAALRALLNPDGLVCQWLPLYQLDELTLRSIIRSFLEVFPETQAFLLRPNIDTPVLGLVGWITPPRFDAQWWSRRVTDVGLLGRLKWAGLSDGDQLFGLWLAGPEDLRAYADGAPRNTDDRPSVIYSAPRAAWRRTPTPEVLLLDLIARFGTAVGPFPVRMESVADREWWAQIERFRRARDEYLRGLVAEDAGHLAVAEALFLSGARRSPEFTSGYSRLLTRAMALARERPAEARRLLQALVEARPERPIAADLLRRLGE